jgi:hypothetical protein
MRKNALRFMVPWILVALALSGCGGGGGGTSAPPPSSSITGSVTGTVILAVDENANIAARDDTAGRTPVPGSTPPRYPFTLNVPQGHQYHLFFIVTEGTPPTERIVPLSFGTTNVFSIGSASSIDLGFVDTSAAQATAEKSPFAVSGVTPGAQTGVPTIRVEGFKFFLLLDQYDGVKRYRAQVRVKDADGNVLTNGSLVKGMKVYSPAGAELSPDVSFFLWNGSGLSIDNGGGILSSPTSDIEVYLAAAPGTLPGGFYTVVVTDSNGNLFTSKLYFETPTQVGKPTGLSQAVNADNSITLSWTNPAGISAPAYQVAVYVVSDDGNGDGQQDSPLIAYLPTITNSYTIPVNFVQSALTGKTGLNWMVEIRQQTTTPVTFPDGTSSTAQFYRTRSAQAVLSLPDFLIVFSQADLSGRWDGIYFGMGIASGWKHADVTIDNSSGGITWNSLVDSAGGTSVPAPGSFIWTISAAGVVSESSNSTFHGQMSLNKLLVIGTDSGTTPGSPAARLRVFRKRTGTLFSNADLANIPFVYHSLRSGKDNNWQRGAGTTDSSGNVTLSSRTDPSGTSGPFPNVGALSVNSVGIVTDSMAQSFYGIMTDDKKVIFQVGTPDVSPSGTTYESMAIQVTGQTYTQADYSGTRNFSSIRNTVPYPYWNYGVSSVDAAGNGTILSYTDIVGSPTPANFTRILSASGEITIPGDATANGQMSYNKEITVWTGTISGRYQINIGFR